MTGRTVYACLLRLYPRSFRAHFADAMRETFAEDLARVRASGRRATAAFWISTISEAIAGGFAERRRLPVQGPPPMSGLFHDCRDAFRALRGTPLVTAVAIFSLALGVGANTALFSILNGLVLKPLPVREPGSLMLLDGGEWTNPIWEEIRGRQSDLSDGAFAWSGTLFNLSDQGPTDLVHGAYASGGIFDVLGVRASLGRMFTAADDAPGGGPDGAVAVISDRLWRQRFNAAPDVAGRRLSLNGVPFTIVGVASGSFFGPDVGEMLDVFVPLGDEALIQGRESILHERQAWWLEIMARRKAGQSIDQANAGLRAAQPQIREATLPASARGRSNYLAEPLTLVPAPQGYSPLRTRYEAPLTIIMAVVGAVLLIACANIASLLLARAVTRRRELVIRLALGASRLRLARTLMLESLMLAFAGAAFGLALAREGSALLLRQLATPGNTVFLDLTLDTRVLSFTTAVAVVTALVFGLAPAIGASATTANEALKENSRSLTGDRRWSLRNALVVVQVALSLTLLVGAGLFVRTFAALTALPLGMTTSPLVTAGINVQRSATRTADRAALFERFRAAALSTPGATDAALSVIPPLTGLGWNTVVEDARHDGAPDRERMSWLNGVSPHFFATYGITLTGGRDFTSSDRDGAPLVAIVNRAFAKKFLGGGNPVGREVLARTGSPHATTCQVVGVVSDAFYRRLREGVVPTLYVPLAQVPQETSIRLAVKAAPGARATVGAVLAQTLAEVDPAAALTIRPFDDYLDAAVTQERLVAILAGFFGALALLLAALGLYGVTTYGVNRRRTEIGVRMALGADPRDIVGLVLVRVGGLVFAGVVCGMALSWWVARYVSASMLFGVAARDAATFALAALVLTSVAALAGWLPARRAARIDPVSSLRDA